MPFHLQYPFLMTPRGHLWLALDLRELTANSYFRPVTVLLHVYNFPLGFGRCARAKILTDTSDLVKFEEMLLLDLSVKQHLPATARSHAIDYVVAYAQPEYLKIRKNEMQDGYR
jgi:hypothetical protein